MNSTHANISYVVFCLNDTATTEIYTLALHDALPIAVEAFDAAGDPDCYPDAGDPWQPLKLYYHMGFSRARLIALHEAMLELWMESPYAEWLAKWEERSGEHTDELHSRQYLVCRLLFE